jgi:hypothetical protein
MTPEGQSVLYGGPSNVPFRSTISFVAGHSGMGKSTLMDRILVYAGNQVYRHSVFRGASFPETQILWLRRNLPEHCTLATLCSTFGDHTDQVLNTDLYGGIFSKPKADRNLYLREIRKIITNHHVGMLVLDEFQNLSLMGVGAEKIIALLVNLRDELGLPIVVVGTYKALKLLEGTMSSARRLCEGGFFDLERPMSHEDDAWNLLCSAAWEYQWVRQPREYSDAIAEALYDVSQGISGIMLTVLATAQLAAMEDDGEETVDADLIRKVYHERMRPLHPALHILRSGDPRLLDKFDDLYRNAYPTIHRNETEIPASSPFDKEKGRDKSNASPSANSQEAKPKTKPGKSTRQKRKHSPSLSEDQIKQVVLADSINDLASLLDQ